MCMYICMYNTYIKNHKNVLKSNKYRQFLLSIVYVTQHILAGEGFFFFPFFPTFPPRTAFSPGGGGGGVVKENI